MPSTAMDMSGLSAWPRWPALILLETGLLIGWKGLKTILAGPMPTWAVPGMLALVAAAVSIVVKEWMYWYTRARGQEDSLRRPHGGRLASPV